MKTSLITKEQYLNFVADWKNQYRQISTTQRQVKRAIREAHRLLDNRAVASQSEELRAGKKLATEMLERRAEWKLRAREAYLAIKALRPAD